MADQNNPREYEVIIHFKDGTSSPPYTMSKETLDKMIVDFAASLRENDFGDAGYEVEVHPDSIAYRKTKLLINWAQVRMIG